ncbi:Salicylate O-methyltransferase [Apostasia shenzhenica]|uniref:Salicylate O-methyltransferase n=1 Tax=Apostasia shenzhenica TaxID=1088818 RepID=A0A2I0A1A8_9ASPA|nr:Salicylate O-methyltransferase [Apostasia shenzhenica]
MDGFDAPYYALSPKEASWVVEQQGCFAIRFYNEHDEEDEKEDEDGKMRACYANRMAKSVRAVVESMLVSHFGEAIIEQVFQRYERLTEDYYSKNKPQLTNLVLSLVRKSHH